MFADTPKPPYYAVIFTSIKSSDTTEYDDMAERMWQLAHQQPGFLGAEAASEDLSITISYWQDLAAIQAWKQHEEHLYAQQQGREKWYTGFKLRIAKVEQDQQFYRL